MESDAKKILARLQEDLQQYERVLLISSTLKEIESFQEKLMEYLQEQREHSSGLLLLLWDGFPVPVSGITARTVSEQEERMLSTLYRMYDCSDRFSVWSDDRQCGTILNYVRSGMLTWDEAFRAMLNIT